MRVPESREIFFAFCLVLPLPLVANEAFCGERRSFAGSKDTVVPTAGPLAMRVSALVESTLMLPEVNFEVIAALVMEDKLSHHSRAALPFDVKVKRVFSQSRAIVKRSGRSSRVRRFAKIDLLLELDLPRQRPLLELVRTGRPLRIVGWGYE